MQHNYTNVLIQRADGLLVPSNMSPSTCSGKVTPALALDWPEAALGADWSVTASFAHRWGSHGHKPWLWPYHWGDSARLPISARGSRHLVTVIYSCRSLHFSITQIHRRSTAARAMGLKQTRSTLWAKFQHRLRQLCIIHATRSSKPPSTTCCMPQRLAGEPWLCKQPAWAAVSPAQFVFSL